MCRKSVYCSLCFLNTNPSSKEVTFVCNKQDQVKVRRRWSSSSRAEPEVENYYMLVTTSRQKQVPLLSGNLVANAAEVCSHCPEYSLVASNSRGHQWSWQNSVSIGRFLLNVTNLTHEFQHNMCQKHFVLSSIQDVTPSQHEVSSCEMGKS
jgi:hypothetical protein